MRKFKTFLLNEEKSYLGHKVGDVLTSMQDIQTDMENLGSRQLVRMAEEIVNQIRKILHGSWTGSSTHHLKDLQRVAVSLMRTIEEKGDLKEAIPTAVQFLQKVSGQLGIKVNNLEAPEEGGDIAPEDFQTTPQPDPQAQQGVQQPQGDAPMPAQAPMPPAGPPMAPTPNPPPPPQM